MLFDLHRSRPAGEPGQTPVDVNGQPDSRRSASGEDPDSERAGHVHVHRLPMIRGLRANVRKWLIDHGKRGMTEISERLRSIRECRHLSRAPLARIESGESGTPRRNTVRVLADGLRVERCIGWRSRGSRTWTSNWR